MCRVRGRGEASLTSEIAVATVLSWVDTSTFSPELQEFVQAAVHFGHLLTGGGRMTPTESYTGMRAAVVAGCVHTLYAEFADCRYGLMGTYSVYGCGSIFRLLDGDHIAGERAFHEPQRRHSRLLRAFMIGKSVYVYYVLITKCYTCLVVPHDFIINDWLYLLNRVCLVVPLVPQVA
jgi:hypothetical protein